MKAPRITINATETLLKQLLAADTALKASKKAGVLKEAGELRGLIVSLTVSLSQARERREKREAAEAAARQPSEPAGDRAAESGGV